MNTCDCSFFLLTFNYNNHIRPAPAPAPKFKMNINAQQVSAHISQIEKAVQKGRHTANIKAVMKGQKQALVSEKSSRKTVVGLIYGVEHIIFMATTGSQGGRQSGIQCQGVPVALPGGMGKFRQNG